MPMKKEGLERKYAGQFKSRALLLLLGCSIALNTRRRNVCEWKTRFNFILIIKEVEEEWETKYACLFKKKVRRLFQKVWEVFLTLWMYFLKVVCNLFIPVHLPLIQCYNTMEFLIYIVSDLNCNNKNFSL